MSAALAGAKNVTSLDSDGDAIALARQNFELNGLDPSKHDFMVGDVFKWLAQWKQSGRRFDLVVLDPPAFAKSQAKVPAALNGYASLNRAALGVLSPGGILHRLVLRARHARGLRGRHRRCRRQARAAVAAFGGARPAARPSRGHPVSRRGGI